jgi:hypothetical protein
MTMMSSRIRYLWPSALRSAMGRKRPIRFWRYTLVRPRLGPLQRRHLAQDLSPHRHPNAAITVSIGRTNVRQSYGYTRNFAQARKKRKAITF